MLCASNVSDYIEAILYESMYDDKFLNKLFKNAVFSDFREQRTIGHDMIF